MEKTAILDNEPSQLVGNGFQIETPAKCNFKKRVAKCLLGACAAAILVSGGLKHLSPYNEGCRGSMMAAGEAAKSDVCPVHPKLIPNDTLHGIEYFSTPEYRQHSVKVWSGAVQIDTQVFDDNGPVGEDPRWDVFYTFEKYLKETFPLVYEKFSLEKVNTHGLIFTLKGSNPDLKPVLLAAHQDVVPVPGETISRWTHPPFSGEYDGTFLWGRGSSDCKSDLIGLLEAITALLEQDFEPTRSIILAFGFDEEASGFQGAGTLGPYLLEKLGPDSIWAILDEGNGISTINGTTFALPAVAEKGYLDTVITVKTSGGHSSMPPDHTGIGIMSLLIASLENRPFPYVLTPKNPYYHGLQCIAEHSAEVDPDLKKAILDMDSDSKAHKKVIKAVSKWPVEKNLIRSTRAADVIAGGIKVNALPEEVQATINTRIAVELSIADIEENYIKAALPIAARFGLDLEAYGSPVPIHRKEPAVGLLNLTGHGNLEPSHFTPLNDNPSWDVLGGSANYVFSQFLGLNETVYTAPGLSTGNTDTRYYWDLTDSIYRFSPTRDTSRLNLHAVDEHVLVDSHIEGVAFYYTFLRNTEAYSQSASI